MRAGTSCVIDTFSPASMLTAHAPVAEPAAGATVQVCAPPVFTSMTATFPVSTAP